jgi:hypothetical protein
MKKQIEKIVEAVVAEQIQLQLDRGEGEKLTPEGFARVVSREVGAQLPKFTKESKRDFDDPYDSFSTDIFTRFVTDWK